MSKVSMALFAMGFLLGNAAIWATNWDISAKLAASGTSCTVFGVFRVIGEI
jgi:hypothetical protein